MATHTVLTISPKGHTREEVKMVDDELVQRKLRQAIEILQNTLDGQTMEENPKLWVTLSTLWAVCAYSKSSNGIPGYRGLGLEQALEIAGAIISAPPKSDRDISIHHYRFGIEVTSKK